MTCMNNFNSLINNKIIEFEAGELDFLLLEKYKQTLKDKIYFNFIIDSRNAGFFYDKSLQIYSYSDKNMSNSIDYVNSILRNEYKEIISDLISFAQDLFGNQFCFDIVKRKIFLFNSETGERKLIASDFSNWIDVIYEDFDYFIGLNVLREWNYANRLTSDERLYPKIPFIMGGEFKVNNLFASTFPNYIVDYANIAKQVFNLPDGTPVKLVVDKR